MFLLKFRDRVCMDRHARQDNVLEGSVFCVNGCSLHRIQHIKSINDLSEYRIDVVQVGLLSVRDEKLLFVRVRTTICHG
jgi:hypothetical protein